MSLLPTSPLLHIEHESPLRTSSNRPAFFASDAGHTRFPDCPCHKTDLEVSHALGQCDQQSVRGCFRSSFLVCLPSHPSLAPSRLPASSADTTNHRDLSPLAQSQSSSSCRTLAPMQIAQICFDAGHAVSTLAVIASSVSLPLSRRPFPPQTDRPCHHHTSQQQSSDTHIHCGRLNQPKPVTDHHQSTKQNHRLNSLVHDFLFTLPASLADNPIRRFPDGKDTH